MGSDSLHRLRLRGLVLNKAHKAWHLETVINQGHHDNMSIRNMTERLDAAKRRQSRLTPRAGAWWQLEARVNYLTKALAAAALEHTQPYDPLDATLPYSPLDSVDVPR
jgi:hypothetical protein